MQRAIVTGANGFIGSHLCRALRDGGHETLAASRSQSDIDIQDLTGIASRAADCLRLWRPDVVFHLAGSGNPTSDPTALENGLSMTRRLLDGVHLSGLSPTIVFIGSAAEYGAVDELSQPVSEDWACAPNSPYGRAKLAQTRLAMEAAERGADIRVARLFNILGEGMPARAPLMEIADRLAGSSPGASVRTGRLDLVRDWAQISDVVRVLVALASDRRPRGRVINVCTGVAIELRSLVEAMAAALPWRVRLAEDATIGGIAVPRIVGNPDRLNRLGLMLPRPDLSVAMPALLNAHLATRRAQAAG